MKRKLFKSISAIMFISILAMTGGVNAQTGGTIKGKVFSKDSSKVVPFAIVRMEVAGEIISTKANFNGIYSFFAINAGKYNLTVEAAYGTTTLSGVQVSTDQISQVDIYLTEGIVGEVIIVDWKPKKIDINNNMTMSIEELEHNINIQSPIDMISDKSSEITKTEDNQLIIRGSRPGDVIYYVDGVKQNTLTVPGVSIGAMTVYTGGIPAKYGDTTGGVVILETKGYFDLYYAWKVNHN